jgi:hypothetical protein
MLKLTATDITDLPTRSAGAPAPQFPTALTPMSNYTEAQQRDMAINALKRLRTYVAKSARWQISCARGERLPLSAMPSRTAVKQSYDKSAYLATWLGWDRTATRCHALIDQVRLVLAAEAILGK